MTNTETEALILEYNLIKQHKPRFNVILRDDKSYPYIYVSTKQAFPRLRFHRGTAERQGPLLRSVPQHECRAQDAERIAETVPDPTMPGQLFLEPQPTLPAVPDSALHGALCRLHRRSDIRGQISTLRYCSSRAATVRSLTRWCRAHGAAAGRLDYEQAARFRDQIARFKKIEAEQLVSRTTAGDLDVIASASLPGVHCVTVLFIRGGKRARQPQFLPASQRRRHAGAGRFGLPAAVLPEQMRRPRSSSSTACRGSGTAGSRSQRACRAPGQDPTPGARRPTALAGNWRTRMRSRACACTSPATRRCRSSSRRWRSCCNCDAPPERLECFDVSHTSGEATVASCVVFNQAGPLKSDYRRFNLSPDSAGDDYAAMAEALRRRYHRVKKGEVPMPDVLFVDGGKGQLAEAMTVLDELELDWIQVVAVAKGQARRPGMEQLFLAGQSTPTILPADSPALHLIQQIRDEAHRFAITGHRQRRQKRGDVTPRRNSGTGTEAAPGIAAAVRGTAGCAGRGHRRPRQGPRHQPRAGRKDL